MDRRSFLSSSVGVACLCAVGEARASTGRLLTLEELVGFSSYVVVGAAREKYSVWEQLPSGRRIVTYTRVAVEQAIVGAPDGELRVRTLGGVVEKIGQSVAGEANLPPNSRSMLFLAAVGQVVVVTAMAQGRYPVVTDEAGVARLGENPETDLLLPRPGPAIWARDRLVGATVDEASKAVLVAKGAR